MRAISTEYFSNMGLQYLSKILWVVMASIYLFDFEWNAGPLIYEKAMSVEVDQESLTTSSESSWISITNKCRILS